MYQMYNSSVANARRSKSQGLEEAISEGSKEGVIAVTPLRWNPILLVEGGAFFWKM
jgi:hypothetical protein